MVIDYGRGNLFSLMRALDSVGCSAQLVDDPAALTSASRVILPGVGAFGDAMAALRRRGFVEALRQVEARGIPLLGICIGCQLLLDRSEEFGSHEGLGMVAGTVQRLPPPQPGDPRGFRIPNIGWRRITVRPDDPVVGDVGPEDMVYFVHSFAPFVTHNDNVIARMAINGADVPVAVRKGNVFGVQFHPEKSSTIGLSLLSRFGQLRA